MTPLSYIPVPRRAAAVPGRGGQIERGTDMRTSRVRSIPRGGTGRRAAKARVRPTGGRVADDFGRAAATSDPAMLQDRQARRKAQRKNAKIKKRHPR